MRHRYLPLLTLLFTLLPGCKIVDVQPFTTATKEMGSAISASLQQVQASFKQADKVFKPTSSANKQVWGAYKVTLEQSTDRFKQVATSFNDYAKALEAVTADGKAHEEKIDKVFKATNQLVDAAKAYVGPYAIPLATASNGLDSALVSWVSVKTNRNLKALASPEQDSVIQKTARLLRAGLKQYAKADSGAYNLLLIGDSVHTQLIAYENLAQRRRNYAYARLYELVDAENILLGIGSPPSPDLLYHRFKDRDTCSGPICTLINRLKVDTDGTLYSKWNAFSSASKAFTDNRTAANSAKLAASSTALTNVVRKREKEYRDLADNQIAQVVFDTEEKRWNNIYTIPQQKSREQFEKSQQVIKTWATSHHELRLLLLKAGKVTRQDLVDQGQSVQKLIAELKDAREAAARAAKAAADKAAADKTNAVAKS